ncbi:MAG: substrate-binding domain-containing protein [Clostridia bacterium]|nr:substrate-binding domain-containing protein [Clostridia bacterium]
MKKSHLSIKITLTVILGIIVPYVSLMLLVLLSFCGLWSVTIFASLLIIPLIIPLIWIKKRKPYFIAYMSYLLCFTILVCTQVGMNAYNDSITIDTTPSINVNDYMPFDEASKIVKLRSKSLNFENVPKHQLPVIDGAAAAFPVYSAFVNAVYPDTTKLRDGVFEYNNTLRGYELLAKKETDIFIGAAPSEEQISFAEENGTTFKYTQIGSEAFVFFVHKDNPIDSLTVEQIKGIYSGKITNWSQVGGKDEKIVPFQRNEGSGSQSMLIRFMEGTPIIEPDMQTEVGGMGGIIEQVADYKNKSTSIGFSFRFYVEGIIKNPDIKMIAIEGVAPTKENIKNGSYAIIAPVFAVTQKENSNENVQKLIDWILSDEGQYIIEETGYVGIDTN